jgi:hypothetical protein
MVLLVVQVAVRQLMVSQVALELQDKVLLAVLLLVKLILAVAVAVRQQ